MGQDVIDAILGLPSLKGVVMETYGSGNAPAENWFLESLRQAIERGVLIYNVSQCNGGTVVQGRYETSKTLLSLGVLSGGDITTEAAVTKLMFLLAHQDSLGDIKRNLTRAIRGEMS